MLEAFLSINLKSFSGAAAAEVPKRTERESKRRIILLARCCLSIEVIVCYIILPSFVFLRARCCKKYYELIASTVEQLAGFFLVNAFSSRNTRYSAV
jgi:hypothetical protein